jgi:hypothetical protein
MVPLWHVAHDPCTAEWSICAGVNRCVLWHESQLLVEMI